MRFISLVVAVLFWAVPSFAQQEQWFLSAVQRQAPLTQDAIFNFRWDAATNADSVPLDVRTCEEVAWRWNPTTKIIPSDGGIAVDARARLLTCSTDTVPVSDCNNVAYLQELRIPQRVLPCDFSPDAGSSCVGPGLVFDDLNKWRVISPPYAFLRVQPLAWESGFIGTEEFQTSVQIRCRTKQRNVEWNPATLLQGWEVKTIDFSDESDRRYEDKSNFCTDQYDNPAWNSLSFAAGCTQTDDGTPTADGLCDEDCQPSSWKDAGPWAYTALDGSTTTTLTQGLDISVAPFLDHTIGRFKGASDTETAGSTWNWSEFPTIDTNFRHGEPRKLILWASVGFNGDVSSNNYFFGLLTEGNDMFNTDGTIDGDAVGVDGDPTAQCVGFWMDDATDEIYVVYADTIVLYGPYASNFAYSESGAAQLRLELDFAEVDNSSQELRTQLSKARFYVNDRLVHESKNWDLGNAYYWTDGMKPGFGHYVEGGTSKGLKVSQFGWASSIGFDGRVSP